VAPTNVAPVAVVSPTSLAGQAPFATDFDGTDSTDVDGSVVSYAWDFGDGGTASGASPAHTFAEQGTFTVTLTVTAP
jgi:PKD repeat protein